MASDPLEFNLEMVVSVSVRGLGIKSGSPALSHLSSSYVVHLKYTHTHTHLSVIHTLVNLERRQG